ncbi:hypothetical protein CXB51_002944 [Gossypium anomalum]|uniref:GAG-pre-integrase domain-containing protein n=1 Tax=Gossypium anomalum TaxID=47600 RepID=A0A8J5ZFP7_9ROSI|nr:hypothetical protein CXB51_002944 [Gossypium anomalum]
MVSHQSTDPASNSTPPPTYRPSSTTRGRGRGRSSGTLIQCQLCGKMGHLVDRCYYQFDASYKSAGYKPPPSPQANVCMFGLGSLITPWVPSSMPIFPPTHVSARTPTTSHPQAYFETLEIVGDNAWYPDSGTTHHLTHLAASLGDSLSYNDPSKVYIGNGTALPIIFTGQSSLLTRARPLYMRYLLFVLGITRNLLSVSKFTRDNQDSSKNGFSSGSAYYFIASTSVPLSVWHSRLGHPCKDTLTKALLHCNIPFGANKEPLNCVACHLGKEYKLPFSKSLFEYSTPLQLVVADVLGPTPVPSNEFRYYVAFIDAYTRYIWVYFLRQKLKIVEAGLSMLAHASMPLTYWNNTFNSVVYLINRLPSSPLGNISPYEKLFQANGGRLYISRHVIFHKIIFPFKTTSSTTVPSMPSPQSSFKQLVLSPGHKSHTPSTSVPSTTTQVQPLLIAPLSSSPNPVHSLSNTSMFRPPNACTLDQPQPPPFVPLNSHTIITRSKANIFKPKAYMSTAPCILIHS